MGSPAETGLDLFADGGTAFTACAIALLLLVARATLGLRLAGVTGALLLCTGVVGLLRLPAHPAAYVFLALACLALAFEVYATPGLVLHAVAGGVAFGFCGLCLERPGAGANALLVVACAAGVAGGTTALAQRAAFRVPPPQTAPLDHLVGGKVTVLDADGCRGVGLMETEVWRLTGRDGPLAAGQVVTVVDARENGLVVCAPRANQP